MNWKDLKVKTKLGVVIGISSLAIFVVGFLGIFGMRDTMTGVIETSDSLEQVSLASRLKHDFLYIRLDLVYMMLLNDKVKDDEKYADMQTRAKEVREGIKKFESYGNHDQKEKELFKIFADGFETYMVQGEKLATMARDEKSTEADVTSFAATVAPLYNKPAEAVTQLVDENIKASERMKQEDTARFKKLCGIIIAVGIICILISVSCGTFITIGISRGLASVFNTMAAIASGDLRARSDVRGRDEMGLLGNELNEMAAKLGKMVGELRENSFEVSSAAAQMHATAEQLATSSEELAAQATTVGTACEEMSATSSEIANNCHHAANDSSRANNAAEMGSAVVKETVTIMNRIAERVRGTSITVESLGSRSDQIGQIIGTIEDIADQTNLLALNAAIEAARAGEQGRGFAVVADEVRALAERTTRATREIGEMIKSIQQETKNAVAAMEEGVREVERGTGEAARSGEALNHILEQISNVTTQVNQIATAAEEQTATTIEINNNIQQITEVVHHTSSASQEEAAAANQLARLAEDLKNLVGSFKI